MSILEISPMQIRRVGAWFVSFLTFGIVFASHAGEPVKL